MKIEVNTQSAIKGLNNIKEKVLDMTPLMQDIEGKLSDIIEGAFQGEYDPSTGVGWAGLLPTTIKARKRKGHTPIKILTQRGNLASSVVTSSGDDFAQIGTNKVYGAAHQFGVNSFSGRLGKLEARPFIGLSSQDASDIEQLVMDYIEKS